MIPTPPDPLRVLVQIEHGQIPVADRAAAVRCLRKGALRLLQRRPSSLERLRLETALALAATMLDEPRVLS